MLEPYEGKLSRTVLRGEGGSNALDLPDGQINGETRNDNQMEITQSLGSLLTPFYKNALVNRQVATGEYYRDLVKKEITAEVKRAWAYYQYAANLCSM